MNVFAKLDRGLHGRADADVGQSPTDSMADSKGDFSGLLLRISKIKSTQQHEFYVFE